MEKTRYDVRNVSDGRTDFAGVEEDFVSEPVRDKHSFVLILYPV